MLTNDVIFNVDMNAVRDDCRITVLMKHAVGFLRGGVTWVESGDWVHVQDEDGNQWSALVDAIEGDRVRLKIDWTLRTPRFYAFNSLETFGLRPTDLGDVSGVLVDC